MEKAIYVVELNDTVEHVEEVLKKHHLSCVPVVDADGVCFGVISASDLVYFHSINKKSNVERAWEICSRPIIEISSEISIVEAAEIMVENKIHHLVVTENKLIVGIVSTIDLVRTCFLEIEK
jgi:CBS domain-containing protein